MYGYFIRLLAKVLLFFIVLLISELQLSAQNNRLSHPPEFYIRKYIKSGDTLFLHRALDEVNSEFVRYYSREFGQLLLTATARAEKEGINDLSNLYSLVRQYYITLANRPKTLEYALKQYEEISRKGQTDELLWILIDIGNMFFDESEYDQALNFYKKAEEIGLKNKNAGQLAVIYLNYGLVYLEKKEHDEALKYLHKSSYYRIQEKNVRMAASTFVRIASTHIELKQADSTLKYVKLAEAYYYGDGKPDKLTEIPMYINLAWFQYYGLIGDHAKAVHYFEKTQEHALKLNMTYDYYCNIFYESKYYVNRGDYQTAVDKVLSTLPYFRKNKMPDEERYVCKTLGKLYTSLHQPEKANAYLNRYIELDDSIRKSSVKTQLDVMRTIAAVYESDVNLERAKKNLEIEKINNSLRIKERNASTWIAGLAVVGVMILLGLFLNLRKNRRQLLSLHKQLKKQHKEIKISSIELERTNQIKDKLFSIIAHDLRNPLNRLMAELSIAQKSFPEKRLLDPMENTLKKTINLFEGLLQWSKLDNRQNIYSPTKVNLNKNINKIISFYIQEIQARKIEVINTSATINVYADHNILQTILRNLLSNAIMAISKTEQPGKIKIETRILDDKMVDIVFSDSAGGFSPEILAGFDDEESASSEKGLGLSICKVLAKMSGWKMEISNGGSLQGAQIVLRLPVYMYEQPADSRKVLSANLPAEWKAKLQGIKAYKFYQISEIRKFIKSLGEIEDRDTSYWIRQLDESVREGNSNRFDELLRMLN